MVPAKKLYNFFTYLIKINVKIIIHFPNIQIELIKRTFYCNYLPTSVRSRSDNKKKTGQVRVAPWQCRVP